MLYVANTTLDRVSDKRQPDAPIVYNDFLILCPAHALSGTSTSNEYFGPCSRTVVSMSNTSELPCAHSYPIRSLTIYFSSVVVY